MHVWWKDIPLIRSQFQVVVKYFDAALVVEVYGGVCDGIEYGIEVEFKPDLVRNFDL